MKTRIKKVTFGDGSVVYTPQYRWFGENSNLYIIPILGWIEMFDELFCWQNFENFDCTDYKTTNIEHAQKKIDNLIELYEKIKAINSSDKIVKKEYIKYP